MVWDCRLTFVAALRRLLYHRLEYLDLRASKKIEGWKKCQTIWDLSDRLMFAKKQNLQKDSIFLLSERIETGWKWTCWIGENIKLSKSRVVKQKWRWWLERMFEEVDSWNLEVSHEEIDLLQCCSVLWRGLECIASFVYQAENFLRALLTLLCWKVDPDPVL